MVNGLITIDNIYAFSVDSDPSLGGGIDAPIGSFGGASDGSGLYYKSGALNTDWNILVTSANLLSSILTGFIVGANTPIIATDSILSAFEVTQGQINALSSKIGGSGTTNKLAKFTASGTIGNSILSDDGTDATSTGILYFDNNKGIDVVTTGGSDVLNIGTANADVINIGWSGASVNIMGNVFYQNVTELQVKDKLFTVNKGGSVGSGASAGFEIEEGGVITGYFATNGTRDGWDFKAPAISGVANLSLSALTSSRTFTLPDVTGTLALLSDITTANITGILSVAKGGTNSGTALNNNRLMISSGGAIVEHSANTSTFVAFYNTSGLPSGQSDFRYNSTSSVLGLGIVPASSQKLGVVATGGTQRAMFVTSAYQTALFATNHASEYSLGLDNSGTTVTPVDIMTLAKAGHVATIGSGLLMSWSDLVPTSAVVGKFGVITTDITAGTYKSAFVWSTPNEIDGTVVERMRMASSGALTLTSPILTGYVSGTQLPNTANSNTVSNTTAETNFTGTRITLSVPANSLKVGDRIKVTAWGRFSRAVVSTLNIRLKIGATTLLATGARAMVTATNLGCRFEAIITVRSIGVGGTVASNLMTLFQEGTFVDGSVIASNGTQTWNTTVIQTLQFSAQFSVANAGNTINLENVDYQILRN